MADPFSADSGGQALSLNPTLGTTELRGTPPTLGMDHHLNALNLLYSDRSPAGRKTNRVIVGNMGVFKG